jgi:hypothetical protein
MFFVLFLLVVIGSANDTNYTANLQKIHLDIKDLYDRIHPPQYKNIKLLPHHHIKRCALQTPYDAVEAYLSNPWLPLLKLSSGEVMKILVGSPCLSSDSIGNELGSYFETVLCARAAVFLI